MEILRKDNLDIIKLSSSTIYKLENNCLFLKCLRTDREIIIYGNRYNLSLFLNSLLIGSPITTIKNIIKLIDSNIYKELEDGGFLE